MEMPSAEDTFTREQIEGVLAAFEDRDAVTASEFWAEDGVFIDPHYPEPEYRGPEEIREALDWALANIVEQPGLTIRNVCGRKAKPSLSRWIHTIPCRMERKPIFHKCSSSKAKTDRSLDGSPICRFHRLPRSSQWYRLSTRKHRCPSGSISSLRILH